MGGRATEEVVFGEPEVTTGASGDLQQVGRVARLVVGWGVGGGCVCWGCCTCLGSLGVLSLGRCFWLMIVEWVSQQLTYWQ